LRLVVLKFFGFSVSSVLPDSIISNFQFSQIFNLRTIFTANVKYKIAANSVQLANCILLHAFSRTAAALPADELRTN